MVNKIKMHNSNKIYDILTGQNAKINKRGWKNLQQSFSVYRKGALIKFLNFISLSILSLRYSKLKK